MDFENPYLASSPDDAATISMAIERLGFAYSTSAHRRNEATYEIAFSVHLPGDVDDEIFKHAIIDVELDVELGTDPAYVQKFQQRKAQFSSAFPLTVNA